MYHCTVRRMSEFCVSWCVPRLEFGGGRKGQGTDRVKEQNVSGENTPHISGIK